MWGEVWESFGRVPLKSWFLPCILTQEIIIIIIIFFFIIMMCGQEVGPKFVAPYLLNSHKLRGHLISSAK